MLSVVPFFEKTPQQPLLSNRFPRIFPPPKKDFFATASHPNKEKCAIAFDTSPKENFAINRTEMWICGKIPR
jgi:hypothetical protein